MNPLSEKLSELNQTKPKRYSLNELISKSIPKPTNTLSSSLSQKESVQLLSNQKSKISKTQEILSGKKVKVTLSSLLKVLDTNKTPTEIAQKETEILSDSQKGKKSLTQSIESVKVRIKKSQKEKEEKPDQEEPKIKEDEKTKKSKEVNEEKPKKVEKGEKPKKIKKKRKIKGSE